MMHGARCIAKTIMDGIKDTFMQIDYAERAKEAGEHELVQMHRQEASSRYEALKRWKDYAKRDFEKDPLGEIMIEHWEEKMHEIERCMAKIN